MLLLSLSTAIADKIILNLFNDVNFISQEIDMSKGQLEELLPAIDSFLKENNRSVRDLDIIAAQAGPGSYTGLRIGLTTANIIAWSLNIPIFSFHDLSNLQICEMAKTVLKTTKTFTKPIQPRYLEKSL